MNTLYEKICNKIPHTALTISSHGLSYNITITSYIVDFIIKRLDNLIGIFKASYFSSLYCIFNETALSNFIVFKLGINIVIYE